MILLWAVACNGSCNTAAVNAHESTTIFFGAMHKLCEEKSRMSYVADYTPAPACVGLRENLALVCRTPRPRIGIKVLSGP